LLIWQASVLVAIMTDRFAMSQYHSFIIMLGCAGTTRPT